MVEKSQPVPPPAYTLRTTPEGLQTVKLWIRLLSAAICTILIGAGATLIWNVAMIMVRYFRKNGQDIHPGTRVGIDLIVWLGFGAVAVMMAATWSTWDTNMAERYYGGANFVLVQMAVVLATIEAFVHIALFIIACHETHVHNRYKKFIRKVRAAEKHAVDGGNKEEI
ncbi:hypothetical protein MHUMG1_03338 [Metarhizium humberi]|uniref:Uncharacterized protein n=2 Tax=Metarhizium TaxID=5529 RepID=A0A9P8S8Z8_9HYPO